MWKLWVVFFLVILFYFVACNNDGLNEPTPYGAYSYTSFDSSGTAIVEGWLIMNLKDSSQIIGKWHFEKIGNPQDIGPQVGNGVLEGGVKQNEMWVELNPQFRDNNLQLIGSMENNKYSGTWQWISFIGITNYGTFEAIKD